MANTENERIYKMENQCKLCLHKDVCEHRHFYESLCRNVNILVSENEKRRGLPEIVSKISIECKHYAFWAERWRVKSDAIYDR